MSEARSIHEVFDHYAAAARAKDVDAFIALYSDDVRVFDMWGRWSYHGAAEWRPMVAEWFGSVGTDRIEVVFDDIRVTGDADIAGASAFVTFKGFSEGGEELRAMSNRVTWVLRRTADGSWKILHEHTSSPIDLESSKAMLSR